MNAWQPRKTAPRDGRQILVAFKSYHPQDTWEEFGKEIRMTTAWWQRIGGGKRKTGVWTIEEFGITDLPFTHWMPLPEPPINQTASPTPSETE